MSMRRLKVAHIVPSMLIGGVEIAIQRSFSQLQSIFDYRVFWVKRRGTLDVPARQVCVLIGHILTGKWRADVVVTSLWYAHPFGYLLTAVGIPWVAFFHNSGFSHPIDRIVQVWAWKRADQRLVDSKATQTTMVRLSGLNSAFLVPYFFPISIHDNADNRDIGCIWVGRNVEAKRLDLYVNFVKLIRRWTDMRCVAVVAGDILPAVEASLNKDGLNIELRRNLSNEDVLKALSASRYFVLTSDYEGMSMTTLEAVQCGCVPVVRPVGEIPTYLDDQSAVFIRDQNNLTPTVMRIVALEIDPRERNRMVSRAQSRTAKAKTYSEEFKLAVESVFAD